MSSLFLPFFIALIAIGLVKKLYGAWLWRHVPGQSHLTSLPYIGHALIFGPKGLSETLTEMHAKCGDIFR